MTERNYPIPPQGKESQKHLLPHRPRQQSQYEQTQQEQTQPTVVFHIEGNSTPPLPDPYPKPNPHPSNPRPKTPPLPPMGNRVLFVQ